MARGRVGGRGAVMDEATFDWLMQCADYPDPPEGPTCSTCRRYGAVPPALLGADVGPWGWCPVAEGYVSGADEVGPGCWCEGEDYER